MGEALAVLALLLFSANVLVVAAATPRVGQDVGFLLALLTNVGGAVLLLAGQALLASWPTAVHTRALLLFAVGGLLTSYLGRRSFFASVARIGPTRASTLQVTNPVFAALTGWVLLGEELSSEAVVAGLIVVLGLVLVTRRPDDPPRRGPDGPQAADARGTTAALLGAASYGLGNVARGAAVRAWPEPVVGSLVGAVAGLIAYVGTGVNRRTIRAAIRTADALGRRLWLLSGVITIGAQTCLVAATASVPIAVAVVVSAAVPVVVLPVGLLMHRESRVGPITLLGVLLVCGGVVGLVLL